MFQRYGINAVFNRTSTFREVVLHLVNPENLPECLHGKNLRHLSINTDCVDMVEWKHDSDFFAKELFSAVNASLLSFSMELFIKDCSRVPQNPKLVSLFLFLIIVQII